MRKIVALADKHPWMVIWGLVVFVLICMAMAFTAFVRHETGQNREQINLIQQQNVAIENAFVTGCRLAVNNARDADLSMLEFIESQLQTAGRTGGIATLKALEQIIQNKENPDTTCVRPPNKENP